MRQKAQRSTVGSATRMIWAYAEVTKRALGTWRRLLGVAARECPICGYGGYFLGAGDPPRYDAKCRCCSSRERHRQLWCLLRDRPELLSGKTVLHFAPEACLRERIAALAGQYIGCDINPRDTRDRKYNIEQIDMPDASVDVIICNHILEHVNDQKALTEMHRVLRPGGIAILTVPIVEGWDRTYENPDVMDEYGRFLYFGQHDHVRYYGRDFRNRVHNVGFELKEHTAIEPYVSRFGLQRGEKIFVATKRSGRSSQEQPVALAH